MKDTQNSSAWNDWANYLLYIVKKHDGDIDKIEGELSSIGIDIATLKQGKLDEDDFQKFLKDDYVIFKTEIKTANKKRDKVWAVILGIVTILSFILRYILKI